MHITKHDETPRNHSTPNPYRAKLAISLGTAVLGSVLALHGVVSTNKPYDVLEAIGGGIVAGASYSIAGRAKKEYTCFERTRGYDR